VRLVKIRRAAFASLIILGFLFLLFIFLIQVTSTPRFCGSCHYMKPYYRSWQTSTHRGVTCVECHIPPGITSEFRKKFEALAMVARYVTGTYSTNPWTEIEDATCLRCHERRLLETKELWKGVLFDHGPHLKELRRKKKLRCTSCHSQIVQGTHIVVTPSSCYLCHFKDQEVGKGTANCLLCHEIPENVVRKGLIEFEHGSVEKFDMECSLCHAHTVRGNGDVPRDRCLTCHNRPDRLRKYGETEFMHRVHITQHKVECLSCHIEIQHEAPREIEIVETPCNTCHERGHSPQRDLYMGIGGKGVEPIPSPMFKAEVRCEGCHIEKEETFGVSFKKASAVSCMNCHGVKYKKIFDMWERGIRWRIRETKRILEKVKPLIDGETLRDIEYNVKLVEEGVGIHNPTYSVKLLFWSLKKANEELDRKGRKKIAIPPTFDLTGECLVCHLGIETVEGKVFGESFGHRVHLSKGVECSKCHETHRGRKKIRTVKIGKSECRRCHHKKKKECSICHGEGPVKAIPLGEEGEFSHPLHVGDLEIDCSSCHNIENSVFSLKREFCSNCH